MLVFFELIHTGNFTWGASKQLRISKAFRKINNIDIHWKWTNFDTLVSGGTYDYAQKLKTLEKHRLNLGICLLQPSARLLLLFLMVQRGVTVLLVKIVNRFK